MSHVESIKQDMDTLFSASKLVDSLKWLPKPLKQRILGFMGTGRRAMLKEKVEYEALVDLGPEFPETNDTTPTRIHIKPDGVKYLQDAPVRVDEYNNGRPWRRG